MREMLKGTSFDNWMHYPYGEPAITGTVTITVTPDSPFVKLKYDRRRPVITTCATCAVHG
ncbi:MAG: hypothetical protein ACLUEV_06285 [Alistipes sp.]